MEDAGFFAPSGPEKEKAAGDAVHARILRRGGGLYRRPALQAKAAQIVERLAPHVRRPGSAGSDGSHSDGATSDGRAFAWRVFLLDDPVPNAFAGPDGRLYFTRGLFAFMNDEAEAAFVVAHEMAHVVAGHPAAVDSASIVLRIARAAAVVAGLDDGATGDAADLSFTAWTRAQETEADALAAGVLAAAGYDPAGGRRALTALLRLRRHQESVGAVDPAAAFSPYGTHPPEEERVAALGDASPPPAAAEDGAGKNGLGNDGLGNDGGGRAGYLAALDGMSWGDAPASGYVAGRRFSHPGLGIGFEVPPGYALSFDPRRVVAENPLIGGLILFDAAPIDPDGGPDAGAEPGRYLRRLWASGPALENIRPFRAAGFAGAVGYARAATPYGEASVAAAVLSDRGRRRALRFVGLFAGDGDAQTAAFDRMVGAATAVAFDDHRRRTAERLDVVRAAPGERVENLAARMGRIPQAARFLRILNGLDDDGEPEPGALLKIIVAD